MAYTIGWSDSEAQVADAEEAGTVLDRIIADPKGPYLLHVIPPNDGSIMQLIWGDSERAAVMYSDDIEGGWGFEPSLPPLAKDIDCDYGSIEPDRTRVTVAAARQAVQEYVATGRRPSNLSWLDE